MRQCRRSIYGAAISPSVRYKEPDRTGGNRFKRKKP